MTSFLDNLFFLAGCASIWYGASLIHPAAGWIVAGFWLLLAAAGGPAHRAALARRAAIANRTEPTP